MNNDLISRQAAIDALKMDISIIPFAKAREYVRAAIETIYNRLEELPSAEPEVRTQMSSADCISKKAAIKSVCTMLKNCFNASEEILESVKITVGELPSAQPEIIRCKDCKKNPHWEWVGCPMTGKNTRKPNDFCSYAERRTE